MNAQTGFPTHAAARAEAHTRARRYGVAYGIEAPTAYAQWTIKMLPKRENRFGFEARIEAVEADDPCWLAPGGSSRACVGCGKVYP